MSETRGISKPTQAFVTRSYKSMGSEGEPEQKDEVLKVNTFVTEPAQVSCEMGLTINLGNFESARIGVTLVVPCYKEEINEAFDFCKTWVQERALQEAQEAKSFATTRAKSKDRF